MRCPFRPVAVAFAWWLGVISVGTAQRALTPQEIQANSARTLTNLAVGPHMISPISQPARAGCANIRPIIGPKVKAGGAQAPAIGTGLGQAPFSRVGSNEVCVAQIVAASNTAAYLGYQITTGENSIEAASADGGAGRGGWSGAITNHSGNSGGGSLASSTTQTSRRTVASTFTRVGLARVSASGATIITARGSISLVRRTEMIMIL
jgi:hypothetical protein